MDIFPLSLPSALSTLGLSTLVVAIAEIGDKTQLLALLLAARFRRPWPIIAGIFVATVLNHALAGWLGALVSSYLTPNVLRWIVAGSFAAIGLWTLKPDTIDEDSERLPARGAFVATVIAFFLAEMGDKTQIATVVLAAKSPLLWSVVMGTTIGMLLANVPVVLLGSRFAAKLPLKAARMTAAALFLAMAAWVAVRGTQVHGMAADTTCADGGAGMLCTDRQAKHGTS
jgi:Ca2+/H+ antiporter, TMEM165/GDT1 family